MVSDTVIGAAAALLASPVPDVTAAEAEAVFRRLWGQGAEASPLNGERDRNFCMTTEAGERFVLKFTNAGEDPGVTAFQTAALCHVAEADPGLAVPRVIPALGGARISWIGGEDGPRMPVRLLSWLEGDLLGQRQLAPRGLFALGEALARLARALAGFPAPPAQQALLWDMQHAASLRPLLPMIGQIEPRAWVTTLLDRFEARALPLLAGLPRGVIHNDLTGSNMLMDAADGQTVAGILDFGDLVAAPIVQEIGVTASYHLDGAEGTDPFAPLLHLLAGYQSVRPLREDEVSVLFDLISTRLALRALIPAWRSTLYPDNRDYLMRSAGRAWAVMQRVAEMDADQGRARLLDLWRKAQAQTPRG